MKSDISNFKAEALTDAEVRLQAPSVFAPGPMNGLSSRYTFVPTADIVAGLRETQWVPVRVEQQRPRLVARVGFQKHLIRFRRVEQMHTLDEWNAELVLTNSHDAGCAYMLQVGIYRRLCSNGLVASDEHFQAIRFRHAGLKAEDIVHASYRVFDHIPHVTRVIDKFRNHLLTENEELTFAREALALRYESPEDCPVQPRTLLTLRRPEDETNDLWTTFNRVQENLIRGGLSDGSRGRNGRLRTLRGLRGIDSKLDLNQALWRLAEQTANSRN